MNISPWLVYLFIKLDALASIFTAFAIISCLALIIMCIVALECAGIKSEQYGDSVEVWDKHLKYWISLAKRFVIVPILLIIICNMIPSTKEMATIYVIPKIVNSEFVNETLPQEMGEIYNLAKDWMRTTLKHDDGDSNVKPVKK